MKAIDPGVITAEQISPSSMTALVRTFNLIMTIVISLFLTLACLRSALNIMLLAALGSLAHVTPVAAMVVTARLAGTGDR